MIAKGWNLSTTVVYRRRRGPIEVGLSYTLRKESHRVVGAVVETQDYGWLS